jgi:SAM-dependent methyltransferase
LTNIQSGFSQIYAGNSWDTHRRSGPGSDPKRTRRYVSLLQDFVRSHNIRSVVDLGCGDWSFSRLVDWSGIDYVGADIVPDLIDFLNKSYSRPGVRFVHANVLDEDLPPADLAIAKDVLQHWPNHAIRNFIRRLDSFHYAILTNDSKVVCRSWRRLWIGEEIFQPNIDIAAGDYRPIRLREAPFNLEARRLAVIKIYVPKFPDPRRRPETEHKEVLLWTNPRVEEAQQ